MTPLFTLTTPNGKTIEGYECTCKGVAWIYCHSNCSGRISNEMGGQKYESFKLSDITEEQAKEWGYSDPPESGFIGLDIFKITVKNRLKNYAQTEFTKFSNIDLSNILLIVINT